MTRIPVEWIDRFFAGESTPDEAARVRDWLAADARHRVFAEALSTAGRDERVSASVRGPAATWERVAQRTTQLAQRDIPVAPPTAPPSVPLVSERVVVQSRWRGTTRWIAAAAATCCIALASVMALRASKPMDLLAHTYTTAAGQRATILLPDGSTVTLAPQTTLAVAFSDDERRLTLSGQAYFDVVKATGAPFVVRTGAVDTRVMGTTFDIRHYAGDPVVEVGVVSGKVAVSGRLGHVLTAGMVGRFSDTSDVVTAQAPDVAWTRGALVFRDTPLPEALATLSRWYGIELRMADSSMASWHVNGTFAGDSRSEALTTLRSALSVNLTYLGAPGQVPVVTLVQRKRTTDRDGNDRRKLKHFTDTSREVGR